MTPAERRAANERIASLVAAKRAAEALSHAEHLLLEVSGDAGESPSAVALQLQVLASVQRSLDLPEAVPTLERALAIRTELFGADHASVGATFRELAFAEYALGHPEQAVNHYLRAQAVWERALPQGHKFLTQAQADIAALREAMAGHRPVADALAAYERGQRARDECQYELAREQFEIAVARNRQELGHDHPDVASCLRALGLLNTDLGDLSEAIPQLQEALYIRAQYRAQHPLDYVVSLVDLARSLAKARQHTEALELFEEALPLADRFRPSEPSALATSQHGVLLRELGRYQEADTAFQAALDELEAIDPAPERLTEHLAIMHSNMSAIAQETGRYSEALSHHREALELKRLRFGDRHPSYARTLLNLAATYSDTGDERRAAETAEEALDILRESGLATAPELGHALLTAAGFSRSDARRKALCDEAIAVFATIDDGDTAELEERRLEAVRLRGDLTLVDATRQLMQLRARTLPADHFKVVDGTLTYVGMLIEEALDLAQDSARERLAEARNLLEQLPAQDLLNPDHATFRLQCAAVLEGVFCGPDAGLKLARRAIALEADHTAQVFMVASERQRLNHAAQVGMLLAVYFSLFSGKPDKSRADIDEAATALLNNKALSIDLGAYGTAPETKDDQRLAHLRSVKSKIAERLLAGVGLDAEALERELDALVAERDGLEDALAAAGFEVQGQALGPSDVSGTLRAGEALLDFVSYENRLKIWHPTHPAAARAYGVFIYRSEHPVDYVDLGSAETTDKDIEQFVAVLGQPASVNGPHPVRDLLGRKLAKRLLIPLLHHLDGCGQLYVAADGGLWAMPFDVLPLGATDLVIDRLTVSYVSSPRDLVRARLDVASGPPIVIADPDFDLEDPAGVRADEDLSRRLWEDEALRESGAEVIISFKNGRPDAPALPTYPQLPGTRREAEMLEARLRVSPSVGHLATKQQLASICSPEILHIATHGFFLEPGGWERINLARLESATTFSFAETTAVIDQLARKLGRLAGENVEGGWRAEAASDDPMILSGLVLAGANTWLRRGAPCKEAGNGHFTAHDVAALDLRGTRLVVLSCCDSARASPRQQAGVFGLRRAFVMAGAEDLVLSLWRVSDEHTVALMTSFYDVLATGSSPADALHSAMLAVRNVHPDPYYWAAFTCQVGHPARRLSAKEEVEV